LLKNIVGLWVVQECRRDWAKAGHDYDYSMLSELADDAQPFASLIDPADPRFIAPDEMPAKVVSFCNETGQAAPSGPGATIRCVLESLALLYRRTLRQLEQLLGKRVERLHIVGGGSRNALLNRFTANALQIPVLIGPVEATAAGNILVQAITLGHLPSLAAARHVVRDSTSINLEQPNEAAVWNFAYERFERLCKR
jgi:rhamnulokinase